MTIVLRHLAEQYPEAVSSAPGGEARSQLAPQARAPSAATPILAPPITPAMDCGLVNGVQRCFPRANTAPNSHVPTAADEVDRAIEIMRSEEHTSELQSLMRISYARFCFKKN